MSDISRRDLLRGGAMGLAALGLGACHLRSDAAPTEPSGKVGDYGDYLKAAPAAGKASDKGGPAGGAPTEDNIQGPFYRSGAPYRAKITPPLEPGPILLVRGRVWGHDTKKPLVGTVLDIWQANAKGRYDNDDPRNPPGKGVFLNRARLITDENGYYEYETVHPGHYPLDETRLRPAHIHYYVRHPRYQELITQLYFNGDPHNDGDPFIKPSLIIDLRQGKAGSQSYEIGDFDIVLAPK